LTAQFDDTVVLSNKKYILLQAVGEGLFLPQQFGMRPHALGTACYRGFYLTYSLTENKLFLQDLTLREAHGNYVPINRVTPVIKNSRASYQHLNLQVQFSGVIRLVASEIKNFQSPPTMNLRYLARFRSVIDAYLDAGIVTVLEDRSADIHNTRISHYEDDKTSNVISMIEENFKLSLNR